MDNQIKEVKSENSKKSKNSKENKSLTFSLIKLHPAGDVILDDKLVYEPLGEFKYIYKKDNQKGIATTTQNPMNKKEWIITFDDINYVFNGKPLFKLPYKVPEDWEIENWINGVYPEQSGEKILKELIVYFRTCLDLIKPNHYYHPIITSLQSWLRPLLKNVFYCGFSGKFGGGKTKATESMSTVSYHGWLIGDLTQACVSRLTDKYKLSLYVDELDEASKDKQSEIAKIFRQGYRKDNPYVRLKDKTYEEQIFDIFGTKGYTIKSNIEPALQQRTLMTPMRKTDDKRLPLIDMYIKEIGSKISKDLFFWYLDNIVDKMVFLPSLLTLPQISEKTEININQIRQDLYDELTKDLIQEEKDFLNNFSGRNIELSFNIILISKAFEVNLTKELKICFEEKEEIDTSVNDDYYLLQLKELLINLYNNENHYLEKGDFKDYFYFPKNEIYDKLRSKLKEKNLYIISLSKFNDFLTDTGFQNKINIKREYFKGKNLLCLIYDNIVLKELEIESKPKIEEIKIKEEGGD